MSAPFLGIAAEGLAQRARALHRDAFSLAEEVTDYAHGKLDQFIAKSTSLRSRNVCTTQRAVLFEVS
jgi:hypothetical protein